MVIDGKKIAEEITANLKKLPKPDKFFAAVLVGDDPASVNFLKQKEKVGTQLGVEFRLYKLPVTISTDELRHEIGRLASPKNCGAFIVQLPLPEGINRYYALNAIPKWKDVDFLSEAALGAFYTGRAPASPPSVETVAEILKLEKRNLRDLTVVMVGAGFLIGKPVGFWLQNRVAELTVLDITVKDIHSHLKDADIVISGVGQSGLFSAGHLKKGAMVIDFGFSRLGGPEGKIVGDFDPSAAEDKDILYTRTPGGTGPVLVAKLFENFYKLSAAGSK